MKKGFLPYSSAQRPPDHSGVDRGASATSIEKYDCTPVPTPAPTLQLTPEQWQTNFQQCLELLKGPTDEKRFVGLLLATKLLPSGGHEAIRAVLEALGWRFISRLLTPLSGTASAATSVELREQHIMGAGLGLAILSSACSLPEVAAGEQLASRVPLLLRVVTAGGVSQLINRGVAGAGPQASGTAGQTGTAEQAVAAQADDDAVSEALECVVAVCSAQGAREAVIGAGGLGAAAAVLARMLLAHHKWKGAAAIGELRAVGGVQRSWRGLMLAVRLLNLLLKCSAGQRAELVREHAREVQALLPALGHLLGFEPLLKDLQASTSVPVSTTPASQGSTGTVAGSDNRSATEDAAALQLECLHALLLLLPLPDGMPQLLAQLKASAPPAGSSKAPTRSTHPAWQSGWIASVRRGLSLLLQSRIGVVQKHSVLQLAAVLVDLLGPGWLGPQLATEPPATAGDVSKDAGDGFLRLLANTLHVELGLLLSDSLHPEVVVDSGLSEHPTRSQWHAPKPSQQLLQELAKKAKEKEEEEAEGTAMAVEQPQGMTEVGVTAAAASSAAQAQAAGDVEMADGEVSAVPGTPSGRSTAPNGGAGQQVTAGARACARLPAVLSLWEALVEVLARDAALDDSNRGSDDEGEDYVWGRPGPGGPERLSAVTQQQLMSALGRAIDEIGQFLEVAADVSGFWAAAQPDTCTSSTSRADASAPAASATPQGAAVPGGGATGAADQQQQHPPRGPRDSHGRHTDAAAVAASLAELSLKPRPPPQEIILGCVRLVGRFLADAPDTHTEGLRKLLPFMLAFDRVKHLTEDPAGPPTLSTFDPQGLGAFAVRLLTPGLLQALSTCSSGAFDIRDKLCSCPLALDTLCGYLSSCAGVAAACAPSVHAVAAAAQAGTAPSATALVKVQELLEAEQQMADAAMLLLSLVDPELAQPSADALLQPSATSNGVKANEHVTGSRSIKAEVPSRSKEHPVAAWEGGGLGPVTRQLLGAVTGLATWANARLSQASLRGAAPAASEPTVMLTNMAAARLMPRALLCAACLAACVLDVALQQLHQPTSGQEPGLQPMDRLQAEASLSQEHLRAACQLVTAGARTGLVLNASIAACQLADEGETWAATAVHGLRTPSPGTPNAAAVAGPVSLMDIVSDAVGDGEVCWERLLGAAASALALLPQLRSELGGPQAASSWLGMLHRLQGLGAQPHLPPPPAKDVPRVWERLMGEVVGSSVNAQLLLATWKAVGDTA